MCLLLHMGCSCPWNFVEKTEWTRYYGTPLHRAYILTYDILQILRLVIVVLVLGAVEINHLPHILSAHLSVANIYILDVLVHKFDKVNNAILFSK